MNPKNAEPGNEYTDNISEAEFLKNYTVASYERPSVTTDIVVLSMSEKESDCHRKDAEPVLEILLIKRGEHPFKNSWALPGGFLRPDETIEECAVRELSEETGFIPVNIIPVGVFSEPDRDPRGRVISNAFASVVFEDETEVCGGGDAVVARWFTLKILSERDDMINLTLKNDDYEIVVELKKVYSKLCHESYEIISSTGLAFDHGKIILKAMNKLRKQADDINLAFEFLGERFTLSALQKVQEILIGKSLLTANFRRKISALVEETDEYTVGAGHRPARLFKRKTEN